MSAASRAASQEGCAPVPAARLTCGVVLEYEARSLVPAPGDVVPCRRHGYCPVHDVGASGTKQPRSPTSGRRDGREERAELRAFLSERPVTTVHALRRRRFTLRVLVAAEADGLLDLDLVTGRVFSRAGRASAAGI